MLYNILVLSVIMITLKFRGVAQFGRALRSGRRGRGFESRHLDQITNPANQGFSKVCGIFLFGLIIDLI